MDETAGGNTSWKSGIAGIVVGIIGGPILYFAVALLITWTATFAGTDPLKAIIFVVLGYIFGPVVLAYIIATIVDKTAGDSHSKPRLSTVGGIMAFASFLTTYLLVLGEEGFDSFIDYGKVVVVFIVLVFGSAMAASERRTSEPVS